MLNFISFASGSSGNCYCLYTEQTKILIDVGIGIRLLKKHLKEKNLSLNDIDAIFVTHDHADHIKALGAIDRDYNIPIYSTALVHKGISRSYCVIGSLNSAHVKLIEKGETVEVGDFKVTAFPVPHDSTDNVGYKVECGGITFCLITDAGHVVPEMEEAIQQADYLVFEANHDLDMLRMGKYPQRLKERILGPEGHLSNKECAETLVRNLSEKIKHVWLCHLSEENNHPEIVRKTISAIFGDYGLVAGKDMQVDVLKRKTPSEIYRLDE